MLGWVVATVLFVVLMIVLVMWMRTLKSACEQRDWDDDRFKEVESQLQLLRKQPVSKQCLDALEDYRSFVDNIITDIAVDTAKISMITTDTGDRLCAKLRAMMPSEEEMKALRDMAGRESESKKASTTTASGDVSGRGSSPSQNTSSASPA